MLCQVCLSEEVVMTATEIILREKDREIESLKKRMVELEVDLMQYKEAEYIKQAFMEGMKRKKEGK